VLNVYVAAFQGLCELTEIPGSQDQQSQEGVFRVKHAGYSPKAGREMAMPVSLITG
jgi:hypothetical protein